MTRAPRAAAICVDIVADSGAPHDHQARSCRQRGVRGSRACTAVSPGMPRQAAAANIDAVGKLRPPGLRRSAIYSAAVPNARFHCPFAQPDAFADRGLAARGSRPRQRRRRRRCAATMRDRGERPAHAALHVGWIDAATTWHTHAARRRGRAAASASRRQRAPRAPTRSSRTRHCVHRCLRARGRTLHEAGALHSGTPWPTACGATTGTACWTTPAGCAFG